MDWSKKVSVDENKKKALRALALLAAVCMTAWGIYRGELAIVLEKAVNVCLECIGLE